MTRLATGAPLTIAVIAPLRHPLGEPHAGGLEAAVYNRIRLLRSRGHRVLVCGVEGSHPAPSAPALTLPAVRWGVDRGASDSTYPPGYLRRAERALDEAMDWIAFNASEIDVVDNHSLHPLPVMRANDIGVPMMTTLHTPPLVPLLEGIEVSSTRLIAVSEYTARHWEQAGVRNITVQHNMVDTATWRLGPGGPSLAWFGRVVPEKAPHLAIHAARRLGMGLNLVGRVGDAAYFDDVIAPMLGDGIVYRGELRARELARLVGHSAAALVTPVWDEPFGLVVAEALATGTPVAVFSRGGVPEVAGSNPAVRLVPGGDVDALAAGVASLVHASSPALRRAARADAARRFSFRRHAFELEDLMRETIQSPVPAERQDLLA
ncbi:glycosyltransferase [Labedella endophytica]|uniref:Glycosyltransferase n=1 Tax=Labedella endophytica TaxID=1523160 RepID=A0A433JPA8_9MICO|nr:glycosyltransferase [Labedella endophytica]RUQ98273.1 glycosyltransferase [Labedella endophytica]